MAVSSPAGPCGASWIEADVIQIGRQALDLGSNVLPGIWYYPDSIVSEVVVLLINKGGITQLVNIERPPHGPEAVLRDLSACRCELVSFARPRRLGKKCSS